MPYKDPEIRKAMQKIYRERWYQKHKELTKARSRESRKRYKAAWLAFKGAQACAHCGIQHPALIDFHHVVREGKRSVWGLVMSRNYEEAMKEAREKCLALCANCHRMLHWQEAQSKRKAKKKKTTS